MPNPQGTRPQLTAQPLKLTRCAVAVKKGKHKGLSAALDDGPLVIGSSESCDLVIPDDTVSGRHCELSRRGESVVVRDLGSTNGVRLNGTRVLEAWLEPGSELQLGEVLLTVKAESQREVEVSISEGFGALYGKSAAMRAVFAQLPALAASAAPLLIEGETGTGKDVTAEAIHRASPRADKPFIVFDCGAVAASVLESELFGHEKGAFTGAAGARVGLVEAAEGGTLMLDEIGELPLELQPKLLRLLEKKELRRVGATASTTVDVRMICCTHRSLSAEVKAGRFRQDLYYRLSALKLRLPALRERTDDLPGLVDRLLQLHGSKVRFEQLPDSDRALLMSHRWPGNVRELRNVVERLVTGPSVAGAGLLERDSTSPSAGPRELLPLPQARERSQSEFERAYCIDVLARANGSVTEAARLAGVSRQFLQRLLKRHGLRGADAEP